MTWDTTDRSSKHHLIILVRIRIVMENLEVIKITYNDGIYVGQYIMKGDEPIENGVGVFTWSNGDVYEGEYLDGMRNGNGLFIWADGKKYEGDFVDDMREGTGRLEWADGTFYEGGFVNGKMHGKGRIVWSNGEIYVGWFANDKMEGHGIHYAKDGTVIYDGDWVQSCPVNLVE